ncbi:MAG TPA: chemotaxis protein CheW [Bryobacteraceae bacterium]|nr:chemotaxis protein CheW [Bryobacteraceae bacterium]
MEATLTRGSANAAETAGQKADRAGKYLTFHLGPEEFGIRVMQVREIIGVQDITSVPQTPEYIKGVINLRGKVTPVICLRLRFGMPATEYTSRTCIIVVQVKGEAGPILLGVLVDGVSEVATLAASDIEDPPDFGNGEQIPYILGMAKTKGRVRILLDIDAALSTQDLHGLESITKAL